MRGLIQTRKDALAIPIVTLLLVAAILLNIPIIRDVIVFAYLSFVPGFVILKTLKLKEIGLLNTFLISVGLSLFSSMFVGLLVNEAYLILGLSTPLSIIPLTAAMSTFTLILFFISYRRDFSISFVSLNEMLKDAKNYFPLVLALIILPILSIVSALYANIPIMIILCLAMVILCVLSLASHKIIPSKYYPFLVFSISISILLLNLLMSKYIIGDDASMEYYVFRITQTRGYWGSLSAVTNPWPVLFYNSMLSVTLLPSVYSVLMNLQNAMLFKILYSFVFSLVPLSLYGIYKNVTSKMIGLLSTLFFIFTVNAFFGELTSVDRQIIGEFFLVLSILIWLEKTLPLKEKRLLLIIFGAAIAISHYSIAIIYVILISLIVIISSIKPKFDNVFDASTVLAIFGITFLWYAFSTSSIITPIITKIQGTLSELTNFGIKSAGSTSVIYGLPQTFTVASWINLAVSGVATLFLVIGIPIVILLAKRMEISDNYKLIIIVGAIIFAVSYLLPTVAATLNFTRFYAITMLFLSPCFAIGALTILKIVQDIAKKRNKNRKSNAAFLNKRWKTGLLLVAIILSAYFLSQSGFVNYATGGAVKSPTFDYNRMATSSNPNVEIQFYGTYIQAQDAFSADWLVKYTNDSSIVYADSESNIHVLISCSLIPFNLIQPLTNNTNPAQGNIIYLDSLNVVKDMIPASTGSFNGSQISSCLNGSDLIYSNGNSEIWLGT
jgi:uncharacterized membrane protein